VAKSWWPIYRDVPLWVPPIISERKVFFDPSRNPYFKHADVRLFVAERDGRIVGTIAATVDHEMQKEHPGVAFFGFFEFSDDESVARPLFEAAAVWLRGRGMTSVRGPFNFSPNHEFGLLVDGFDTPPCIANPHNGPWAPALYERLGLKPIVDWYAYWMDKGPIPEGIEKIALRFLERNPGVTLRRLRMDRFADEVGLFRDIYNDAWEENWGHVRITDEEFDFAAKNLKSVLDPDLCWFAYVDGECAAASITLPDYNQVAKKMNGRILPFGWWHFLRARHTIDQIRIFVLGVKKKYQRMPLGAPLYLETWKEGLKRPIRGAEASLVLHDNFRMRGALEKLGARIYKTYRTYEIQL
jgi:ribosomal protein S18 acetylase RimI-like enzyme